MTRLVAVSYLNTKPFLEGLARVFTQEELEIAPLIPSACASDFFAGHSPIALIPSGSLLGQPMVELLDGYCIGADGHVNSVFLFAQEPIENIETVYLDWHSLTSNGLVKLLLADYWQRPVAFKREKNYFDQITGSSAGVIIGDRAIQMRHHFTYAYDLAEAWKAHTGLPFAFAVWAFRRGELPEGFLVRISEAFAWGQAHIPEIAAKWASSFEMSVSAATQYLSHEIDYRFDALKQQALRRYLARLAELNAVPLPLVQIEQNRPAR